MNRKIIPVRFGRNSDPGIANDELVHWYRRNRKYMTSEERQKTKSDLAARRQSRQWHRRYESDPVFRAKMDKEGEDYDPF